LQLSKTIKDENRIAKSGWIDFERIVPFG